MRQSRIGRRTCLFLAIAGWAFLSGCGTTTPSQPGSETLLVVPVSLDRSAAGSWDGQLIAKFVLYIGSTSDPTFHAELPLDPNGVYSFTRELPPGRYIISAVRFVKSNGAVLSTYPLNIIIDMAAGQLTIPDLSCVYRISTQGNRISFGILTNHLSVVDARKVLGALDAHGALSQWTLSEATASLDAVTAARGTGSPGGPQTAQWAQTASASSGAFQLFGVTADADGAVYAVGEIEGAATYLINNGVSVHGANKSENGRNAVIIKYDSQGVALWARSVTSGGSTSQFSAAALDAEGNIYAGGMVQGTDAISFGNGVEVRGRSSVGQGNNLLLVKYDRRGNALWARSTAAGSSQSGVRSLAVDSQGNVYAAGFVSGTESVSLGNGVDVAGVFATGYSTALIKYSSGGDVLWARSVQAAQNASWFNSVAVGKDGSVFAAGALRGKTPFVFGPDASAAGSYDTLKGSSVLLAKYDPSGACVWARSLQSGPDTSYFRSVAVDGSGNAFAAGAIHTDGSYDFGNQVSIAGTCHTGDNVALVKYDPAGNAVWARTVRAGSRGTWFTSVLLDPSGSLYAAGETTAAGEAVFGAQVSAQGTFTGGANALLVKYDGSGQAVWAQTVVSAADASWISSLATDGKGAVYAAGTIVGIARFDFGRGVTAAGTYGQKSRNNAILIKYAGQ